LNDREFEAAKASFNQPIEGYLATTGQKLSTDLFTELTPMLWMGGTPTDLLDKTLPSYFRANLNLYHWGNTIIPQGVEYLEFEMYDTQRDGVDTAKIWELAAWAYKQSRTRVTLINCQAGINRSGLVAAATLGLMGYTAEQAISHMRHERSPLVLANPLFHKWVLENV
jgi:protein-tyrosine phosphatase